MGIFSWLFRKRIPANESSVDQKGKSKYAAELISQLNDSNDFSARTKAIETLGRIGKPVVEGLLEAMGDPATKWGSITALGDIGVLAK